MKNKQAQKFKNFSAVTIIILLILALMASITYAYFTDRVSVDYSGEIFFGKVGNVEITGTDVIWQDRFGNIVDPLVRDYVMPGDKITDASFKITYKASDEGVTEKKVYYLLTDGTQYFRITAGELVVENSTAPTLDEENPELSVTGATATLTVGTNTYKLDDTSFSIPNEAQNQDVVLKLFGTIKGTTLTVKVVQSTNMPSAEEAFEVLKTL